MPDLVLHDVAYWDRGPFNATVASHSIACITGPSGGGKTLLLRALADLDPHRGRIALGNLDQLSVPPQVWRRQVGFLPCEAQWWFDTVGRHFNNSPDGFLDDLGFTDEVLEKKVAYLSSGEKKRLALVRLLANRPKALLLDEPTANLDPPNVLKTEALIRKLVQTEGLPVLWVTHEPDQIERVADQVLHFTKNGFEECRPS